MKGHLMNEPLLGVSVYNPGILSKDELIRLFVARRPLLQQILDDLRREKMKGIPQHRLLVGARGMGKSTLLRRIAYAVEDDPGLREQWIPLTFPEEQYNVARLSDLWLNCLDALSDALERIGKHDESEALDDIVDALPGNNEEERSRKALNALLEHSQFMGKRLLLLVDNIDLVLDRLSKEHWTIREMLAKEGAPLLIGATCRPLEPTYVYEGAFYDFFKIDNLNKLQLEEMHGVLQTLATELNAPQVADLLKSDPARIRVLYDLTGGNPRTTVLLFGVLAQGIDGDVRTDLERLLDQCTPLYKARFEELSNQAQQVVDALALHWDPATAAVVAEKARLDVNTVSSHLNRLSEQGVVEKVRLYPKKKTGFQLSERFFNIWYLMRASRRMRRKLVWLSKFLKSFYSQDDLHHLANRYLQQRPGLDGNALVKHAEYGFALTEAMEDQGWRRAMEHTASKITLDIQREFQYLLGDSAIGDDEIDHHTMTMSQIKERILGAQFDWRGIDKNIFCSLLCGCPMLPLSLKTRIVELIEKGHGKSVEGLLTVLLNSEKEMQDMVKNPKLVHDLYDAIGSGLMADGSDVEGAESAAHVLFEPLVVTIALSIKLSKERNSSVLDQFCKNLNATNCQIQGFWLQLSRVQLDMGLDELAEKTLLKTLDIFPEGADALLQFGRFLISSGRAEEAVSVFEKAVAITSESSLALTQLGVCFLALGRIEEAETYLRKAIEVDSCDAFAWCSLGLLAIYSQENSVIADEYFDKAISLSLESQERLPGFAVILESVSRYNMAEIVYRKLVELNPHDQLLRIRMATVFVRNGNWEEAKDTLTSTLKSIPESEFSQVLDELLGFTKVAVITEHTQDTLTILYQAGLAESCKPLIEALKAVITGTRESLLNAAPEIRNAAEKIYSNLSRTGL